MIKPKQLKASKFALFDRMQDGSISAIALAEKEESLKDSKRYREEHYKTNSDYSDVVSVEIKPCIIIIEE